jgi:hypothetical protein
MRALIVAFGIAGTALGLEAQSPPGRTVTLTGCLEGTSTGYLLTRVQQGAGEAPSDRPPAGVIGMRSRAIGNPPPRPMHDSVVARSDGSIDLEEQLNRRIKVTGTLQELSSASGRDPAVDDSLTVLTVTSVQTVSGTCP